MVDAHNARAAMSYLQLKWGRKLEPPSPSLTTVCCTSIPTTNCSPPLTPSHTSAPPLCPGKTYAPLREFHSSCSAGSTNAPEQSSLASPARRPRDCQPTTRQHTQHWKRFRDTAECCSARLQLNSRSNICMHKKKHTRNNNLQAASHSPSPRHLNPWEA